MSKWIRIAAFIIPLALTLTFEIADKRLHRRNSRRTERKVLNNLAADPDQISPMLLNISASSG